MHVRQIFPPTGNVKGTVLAAIAIKDNVLKNVIEVWWNGTSSRNIVVDAKTLTFANKRILDSRNGAKTFGCFCQKTQTLNTFSKFENRKSTFQQNNTDKTWRFCCYE